MDNHRITRRTAIKWAAAAMLAPTCSWAVYRAGNRVKIGILEPCKSKAWPGQVHSSSIHTLTHHRA